MSIARFARNCAIIAGLALAVAIAHAETLAGRVIHVSDGDTVTVLMRGHDQIRVRLAGIDAPESKQDFGRRSRQLMSSLVKGRDVRVIVVDRDKYGRYVARLETEDGDVGEQMLEAGLARVFVRYVRNLPRDYQVAYTHAEALARSENRGLWSDPKQIPPWEWRQMNKERHGFW